MVKGGRVTVTFAVLFFAGSAALETSITAGLGLGTSTDGAVYLHVRGAELVQEFSVPWVEVPFKTPFTYQFRAVLVVPLRVAVNTCEAPSATLALDGVRVKAMLSVTVAVVVLVTAVSAALTISKVTGFGLGTSTEGAVYLQVRGVVVVQEVSVPSVELPFLTPFTFQVSPRLEVPVIVAVKVSVPPNATVEAEGTKVRVTLAWALLLPQTNVSTRAKHASASFFIGLTPP
jgi:hypothetical protein